MVENEIKARHSCNDDEVDFSVIPMQFTKQNSVHFLAYN